MNQHAYLPLFNFQRGLLLLVILLHGCSSAPHKPTSGAVIESREIKHSEVESQQAIEKPVDIGDYATAYSEQNYQRQQAEHYANLAADNESEVTAHKSNDAILSSAELFIQASDSIQAKHQIARLKPSRLTSQQKNRLTIIEAYINYAAHNYPLALQQLMPILTNTTQNIEQQQVDAHLLSSLCYQRLGSNETAFYHLIQREKLLSGSARSENARYLLSYINSLSAEERLYIYQHTELFEVRNRISQSSLSAQDILVAHKQNPPKQFDQWNSDFSNKQTVLLNDDWHTDSPKRIAVLLPLSSRFEKAAQALEAGLQFQHSLNESPYRPIIDIYDIGENPFQIGLYYQAAWQSGADLIIGPLGKNYANQLTTELKQSSISTILLGGDSSISNPNIIRLTLSPEAEGINVAKKAFEQGFVNAAILTPTNENGQRTAQAFSQYWLDHGGAISKSVQYSKQQFDHSAEIKLLFELNQSDSRHRQLVNTLGFKPKFSVYQRKDIDFIFMLADNSTGRLLKPQINFYNGANIPVIANESVYNGIVDQTSNLDLNNVEFPIMPWIIESEESSQYAGQLNRLFAMGMDAYQVANQFRALQRDTNASIEGRMGRLNIAADHHVYYSPAWAKISDGLAVSKEITPSTQSIEQRKLLLNRLELNNLESQENNYNESNWDAGQSRRKISP